ncbi:feruloyl esterase B [Xylariales sp. AK1849]|nr:feruloyl esterase B [Xylariales sp. AK1849]
MAIVAFPILWGLVLFIARYVQAGPCFRDTTAPGQCVASTFTAVLPAGATIERVDSVSAGGTYGEGAADLGYPNNVTNLPELCAVLINVTSSPTSYYRFGLFLPTTDTWNGRVLTVGNGAFLGGINWRDMGPGPHYGFASISTDTGHLSANGDLSWALNSPETVIDWSWRAIHGSVVIGKSLIEAFYQSSITYSYYSGCSTGGRQGLKEIQLHADSFDGALIGAPNWDPAGLMPWLTRLGTLNLPAVNPKSFTTLSQFQLLASTVRTQCDGIDGLVDHIVSSPEDCDPDLTVIQCGEPGVDAANCLTPEQVETAKEVYSDYYTPDGKLVYTGLEHSSENQWDTYQLYGNPANFDTYWEKYFLYNDPSWTWQDYNDTVAYDARRINPGNATADKYDISDFRDLGGKIILYQGTSDGIISTRHSTTFYNRTKTAMGGDIDDFFRFFLVPGMQHCYLSPAAVNAPWMFGAWSQQAALGSFTTGYSVPNNVNRQHDAMLALISWVENSTAVDSIIASAYNTSTGSLVVTRQRPLCPYPEKAVYDGSGDQNAATSWDCA